MNAHYRYYAREMRIRAYAQLLESYKSVTLASMADAYGVSVDYLDRCVRARVRARAWAYLSLAPDKNKLTTSHGDVTWWWGGNRQVCWPTFGRGGASDARPRLRLGGPWAKYAGAL